MKINNQCTEEKGTSFVFLKRIYNSIINLFTSNKTPKVKCSYCVVCDARWVNTLVTDYACDECIPRGCSCRIYCTTEDGYDYNVDNWEYEKDSNGNELPCEDWVIIKK